MKRENPTEQYTVFGSAAEEGRGAGDAIATGAAASEREQSAAESVAHLWNERPSPPIATQSTKVAQLKPSDARRLWWPDPSLR